MDPAVKKETGYIAAWVVVLSLVMEAVFLLLRKWDVSVLFGNLGGAAVAVGNFFLMALLAVRAMNRALEKGKPEEAASRVKATATYRLLGCVGLCVVLIAVFKTNVYATLIPLLFPRIGIAFRPMIDRKRGVNPPESEGSDLID
jgi:Cu/Ag efflux pump CusA